MIHKIYSTLPSFKALVFHAGLNIVLADAESQSSRHQTRNGAGKSSFVEIVNFVLGASIDKASVFRAEALSDHLFGMVFDLPGAEVDAARPTVKSSWVDIRGGTTSTWPVAPYIRPKGASIGLSLGDWKQVLGSEWFGLTGDSDDPDECDPSVRSLIGYFTRRESAGGFQTHLRYWRVQGPGEQQVAISYLLGLDWRIACQWETIRKRQKHLRAYKEIKKEGLLGRQLADAAHLRSDLAVVEDKLRKLRKSVADFRVVPGFEMMEEAADQISRQLAVMAQDDAADVRLLDNLQSDLVDASPAPSEDAMVRMYEELGIVLPSLIVKRLDEVRQFHESVVRNRKLSLEGQLSETENRLAKRRAEAMRLDQRLGELLRKLDEGGALSRFSQLQTEVARLEAHAADLRQQMDAAEQFEGGQSELEVRKHQLVLRLRQEYRENPAPIEHAIVVFGEIAAALYEEGGSLTIGESTTGPTFEVQMHASRSRGIAKMGIFAFDMTLARIACERGLGPGFLIHDSHLYDGVDERQKAIALNIASEYASKYGFQYIVTINSDDLPPADVLDFALDDAVVEPVLTDKTETGGLFGLRFD